MSLSFSQVFGKLISGDAEPTPEQEEKALLSSPEGEEKVHNVFICILLIILCWKNDLGWFSVFVLCGIILRSKQK